MQTEEGKPKKTKIRYHGRIRETGANHIKPLKTTQTAEKGTLGKIKGHKKQGGIIPRKTGKKKGYHKRDSVGKKLHQMRRSCAKNQETKHLTKGIGSQSGPKQKGFTIQKQKKLVIPNSTHRRRRGGIGSAKTTPFKGNPQ